MSTVPERKPDGERAAFSFDQLGNLGVLWLINRVVFHPRGFALALDYAESETEPRGWSLHAAAEGEAFTFAMPEGFEDERFRIVEELLNEARAHGMAPSEVGSAS